MVGRRARARRPRGQHRAATVESNTTVTAGGTLGGEEPTLEPLTETDPTIAARIPYGTPAERPFDRALAPGTGPLADTASSDTDEHPHRPTRGSAHGSSIRSPESQLHHRGPPRLSARGTSARSVRERVPSGTPLLHSGSSGSPSGGRGRSGRRPIGLNRAEEAKATAGDRARSVGSASQECVSPQSGLKMPDVSAMSR